MGLWNKDIVGRDIGRNRVENPAPATRPCISGIVAGSGVSTEGHVEVHVVINVDLGQRESSGNSLGVEVWWMSFACLYVV